MKTNFTILLILLLLGFSVVHAAQRITPDSIEVIHGASLTDLIRGQSAGVVVSKTDGNPAAATEIIMRGLTSIRSDQQPLILIDGVALVSTIRDGINPWNLTYPYSNQRGNGATSTPSLDNLYRKLAPNDCQMPINLLAGIDPYNIESIEILKNTSATAIYGSRGANGVIIIKTKSQTMAHRTIAFSTSVGVSMVQKELDLLSASQFSEYYQTLKGVPYDAQGSAEVNWQRELYSPAVSTSNHFELSGSDRRTNYGVNLLYSLDNGVVNPSRMEQIAISTSVDRQISNMFRTGVRLLLSRSSLSMSPSTALPGFNSAIKLVEAIPYRNAKFNPVDFAASSDDISQLWRVLPRGYVTADLSKTVKFNVEGGVDFHTQNRKRWAGVGTTIGRELNGIASSADIDRLNYDISGIVSVRPIINTSNRLLIKAGGFYFGDQTTQQSIQGTDFFNHSLRADGVKLASKSSKMFYSTLNNRNFGALAAVDYSFKERYSISGGLRADKVIGFDNDFQYFPFAEANWNVGKERWFNESLSASLFSSMVIRAGWGVSGGNNMSHYFLADYFTLAPDILTIPYAQQMNYISRLKTTNRQFNVGLDMGIYNEAVTVGATFYKGDVRDRLSFYDTRTDRPHDEVAANVMTMDKWGVEVSVGATPIKKRDWRWSLQATFGLDRASLKSSDSQKYVATTGGFGFEGRSLGKATSSVTAFINGYAPSVFLGYRTEGIVGAQHLPFTPPFGDHRLREGDIKFVDTNHSGVVDAEDRVVIGSPVPKFVGSFNTTLHYKAISVTMRFDGSYGNDVLNLNLLQQGNLASTSNNVLAKSYRNAWSPAQPGNKGPAVGAFGYDYVTDRMIEDGSYLSLSDFIITYSVPASGIKWLAGLDLSLMAKNLFVITPYEGYNPAVNSFAGDWSVRGVDLGAYPCARVVSLGVKVKF